MTLAWITAFQEEYLALYELLEKPTALPTALGKLSAGRYKGNDILLVMTGMGMDAAQQVSAEVFNKHEVDGALVLGFCGGLSLPLHLGDVVVATKIFKEGTLAVDGHPINARWIEDVGHELVVTGCRYRAVPMVTVNHVVCDVKEKAELFKTWGAEAVDMEAASVIDVLNIKKTPFMIVKVVMDDSQTEMPDFNSARLGTGSFDVDKMSLLLKDHPRLKKNLKKNIHMAREVLGKVAPAVTTCFKENLSGAC